VKGEAKELPPEEIPLTSEEMAFRRSIVVEETTLKEII
jgi:hypothetical protein